MKLPIELQPGESVIATVRRHPLFIWPRIALYVAATVLPPLILLYVLARFDALDGIVRQLAIAVSVIWFLFWAVRTYFLWYRHQNDVWIVTNQRLIDSIKRHWFHHQIASADLVNVVDISTSRSGLLPTTFNFGDVRCETSTERSLFVLAGIPRPSEILGIIDRARDVARRESMEMPGGFTPRQGVTRL